VEVLIVVVIVIIVRKYFAYHIAIESIGHVIIEVV
jgi:hypothetical protein